LVASISYTVLHPTQQKYLSSNSIVDLSQRSPQ